MQTLFGNPSYPRGAGIPPRFTAVSYTHLASFSTTSSKDVYNLVSNGEYVVGLSYESSVVALINDGAPIECVYMEEGNTAMAGGAAIVKNAPNLPAAQAMIDLLTSAEFQDARAAVSYTHL